MWPRECTRRRQKSEKCMLDRVGLAWTGLDFWRRSWIFGMRKGLGRVAQRNGRTAPAHCFFPVQRGVSAFRRRERGRSQEHLASGGRPYGSESVRGGAKRGFEGDAVAAAVVM